MSRWECVRILSTMKLVEAVKTFYVRLRELAELFYLMPPSS
jgi:hypothetical protein